MLSRLRTEVEVYKRYAKLYLLVKLFREFSSNNHDQNTAKGWWDNRDRSVIPEKIALVHSELSEALEAYRTEDDLDPVTKPGQKPDGFAIELADAVIRIMDLAEAFDIPLMERMIEKCVYNTTRPFKHGGKRCLADPAKKIAHPGLTTVGFLVCGII